MKMNKLLFFCLFVQSLSFGQVGINIANPNSKAALEVVSPSASDNRGVLLPRMSTAQMNTIATDATTVGLMVFNTDDRLFYYHDGSEWVGLVPKQPSLSYSTDPSVNGHIVVDAGSIVTPKLDADTVISTRATIDTLTQVNVPGFSHNALVPTGAIIMWSGTTPPTGWGLCNGNWYSNSNQTGSPGFAPFPLPAGYLRSPDLKGRFIVGYDPSAPPTPIVATNNGTEINYGAIGNRGGETGHTLVKAEIPQHTHGSGTITATAASDGIHSHSILGDPNGGSGSTQGFQLTQQPSSSYNSGWVQNSGNHTHSITVTGNTENGSIDGVNDQPHENRPPYYVLAYIIKLP